MMSGFIRFEASLIIANRIYKIYYFYATTCDNKIKLMNNKTLVWLYK